MVNDACPLAILGEGDEAKAIERMLAGRRIAIVGLSDDPSRPSNEIAQYLIEHGYEVVPVNPNHANVLGQKGYASLKLAPGKIDVVNVFRRPEYCAAVAREALEIGAKGIWLQAGIRNSEARKIAEQGGVDYVENRCILVEHLHRARKAAH